MSKRIVLSILTLVVALGLIGVGSYALWSDTVTSEGNSFAAGTIALTVDGQELSENVYHWDVSNMVPSDQWDKYERWFAVKNTGTLPGTLTIAPVNLGGTGLLDALEVSVFCTETNTQPYYGPNAGYGPITDFAARPIVMRLEPGETRNLRFWPKLPLSTDNSYMGKTGTFDLEFKLEQLR